MSTKRPFAMSNHAIARALEMGLNGDDIREAFVNPDSIVASNTHPGWNYRRGRITLGVSADRECVTTIVWSTQDAWEADYARGGIFDGREPRSKEDMSYLRRQL